jgi:hypothetical protein
MPDETVDTSTGQPVIIQTGEVARSSVTIKTTAKGDAQPEVKVYDEDPEVAKTKAIAIYTQIIAELNN